MQLSSEHEKSVLKTEKITFPCLLSLNCKLSENEETTFCGFESIFPDFVFCFFDVTFSRWKSFIWPILTQIHFIYKMWGRTSTTSARSIRSLDKNISQDKTTTTTTPSWLRSILSTKCEPKVKYSWSCLMWSRWDIPNDNNKQILTDTTYLINSYLGLGQSGFIWSH
jgi:hypothetical protein